MKTYSYTKPELNLTIVITPKAWAWAERRYSTPAVYADHQAAQFLAGRPVDNDVVIEWITKPCETESDRGGVAVAQAQPPVTVQPVINAAPVVESAGGEWRATGWFFNGSDEVVHITLEHEDWYHEDGDKGRSYGVYNPSSDMPTMGPAEASKWLRANGHASVADELDAAEKYEPVGTAIREGDVVERIMGGDTHVVGLLWPSQLPEEDWRFGPEGSPALFWQAKTDPQWRILKRKGTTNG